MAEMIFKEVACLNCGNKITYWTTRDHLICQPCKTKIPVEPMQLIEPEVVEDGTTV